MTEAFEDTEHCLGESHCGTCRDREGGREWRQGLMGLFVLPNDAVDFVCPYGKGWEEGQQNQPPSENGGCGCSRSGRQR
jgi:hypothetical protein